MAPHRIVVSASCIEKTRHKTTFPSLRCLPERIGNAVGTPPRRGSSSIPSWLLRLSPVICMNGAGVGLTTVTAVAVPATFALPAIETILKEFERGGACLALNMRELHIPFEAMISVPIEAQVGCGESRNEWRLRIRAAANVGLYPKFDGVLRLMPAGEGGSQLELEGTYVAPFGRLGRAIDVSLLQGAAQSSLHRFLCSIASRIAALCRWAQFA